MHYCQWHIGDFRGATAHLTNEQELAYRRALDWYYDTEKPLPLDTKAMARRLRVTEEDLLIVLEDFFQNTEDGYRQKRCDKEIAEYQAKIEKLSRAGKSSAQKRQEVDNRSADVDKKTIEADKPSNERDANLEQMLNRCSTDVQQMNIICATNQEPRTKNQEEQKSKALSTDVDRMPSLDLEIQEPEPKREQIPPKPRPASRFPEFWEAWPRSARKVGKTPCQALWARLKLDPRADEIIADVRRLSLTQQWLDGFDPQPRTYLSQRRFDDGQTDVSEEKHEVFCP